MPSYRGFPSQNNKPHFFKIFFPELIGEELRIPPAFFKHIDVETHRTVFLMGPSGNIWNVDLVKDARGMSLQNGWQEFVANNSISPNDFLLFRYEGDLRFTVMIFDLTACEKEDAFLATPSQDLTLLRGNASNNTLVGLMEGLIISPHEISQAMLDGGALAITDGLDSRKLYNGSESLVKEEDVQLPLPPYLPKISGGISKERYAVREPQKKISKKTPAKELYKRLSSPYSRQATIKARMANFMSKRRSVTEEEVQKAYETATSFESDNPTALVVMQNSYVYHGFYMNLPISFVRDHLPKNTQKVKLWNANEQSWIVNYIYYAGRGGFSAHWGAFSRANKLERDDVCVFELINENEMQVHIFRVVELTPSSQGMQKICASLVGQSSSCQKKDIENRKQLKKLEVIDPWQQSLIESSIYQKRDIEDGKLSKIHEVMDQQLQEENTLFLPTNLKKLHFEVTLRRHSIGICKTTYLRIPGTFEAMDYLLDKHHVILIDQKGNSWKVNLRQYYVRDRLNLRFGDGWRALCHDNKLEEGDICTFELISKGDNPEMYMKVHKKQVTLRQRRHIEQ